MIKPILQLYYQIDSFCTIYQYLYKQPRDNAASAIDDDNRSIRQNILTFINTDILKKLFELIKSFYDFIIWIEDYTKIRLYRALQKVLPSIYKLIEKYKRYSAHYMTLAMNNQYIKRGKNGVDIKVHYILISINKILDKLYKYQELLSQFFNYPIAISIKPTI